MSGIKEKQKESVEYLWNYKNNKMCFKNWEDEIKNIKNYKIKLK